MKRIFQEALLPLEQAFHVRTGSIFHSMKKRFSERHYKTGKLKGRIFRAGIELPFDLQQFREFVLECLGGNQNGSCLCHYCKCALDARTIGFDHEMPIAQGGHVGFLNLKPCCAICNRLKGKLSPLCFAWLKKTLREEIGKHLTVADHGEIMMRLKGGGGAYKTSKKAKDASAALKAKQAEDDAF